MNASLDNSVVYPDAEFLLDADLEIAIAEFESFCARGLSLTNQVTYKRHKTKTSLVQFGIALNAAHGFEIGRVEFKPSPGHRSFVAVSSASDQVGDDLEGVGAPILQLIFVDFVAYMNKKEYLAGGAAQATKARTHWMSELRTRSSGLPRHIAALEDDHRKERASLPSTGEMNFAPLIEGLTDLRQGYEQRRLDSLVDGVNRYLDEAAEVGQLGTRMQPDEDVPQELDYLDARILQVVRALRSQDIPTTDDAVAARLPLGRKGRSITRETVNRRRNKLRKRGLDV